MNLLVLTDHATHSKLNSFYGIVNALLAGKYFTQVFVVSRSEKINKVFFQGKSPLLWGVRVHGKIEFPANHYFKSGTPIDIDEIDFVFLRLPRPIHPDFFSFLEKLVSPSKIINRPSGIVRTGNKSYLCGLEKFVVPMKHCRNWEDIKEFVQEYDCVLKPLESYGGRGLVKIENSEVQEDGKTISLEAFESTYKLEPVEYLAMKYLPGVSKGDKRIVVVNGEILTANLRLPKEGEWLCNIAQGGTDQLSEATPRELEIVEYLNPILAKEGIFYYGLDTLEDDNGQRVISEINTLSIGGIAPAEAYSQKPLCAIFAKQFADFCQTIT